MELVLPDPVGEGCLFVIPIAAGNLTWDWAVANLAGAGGRRATLARAVRLLSRRLLPHAGLTALPHFNRPNPFTSAHHGAGAVVGLRPDTPPADMLRAVACGLVFELHRAARRAEAPRHVEGVVLAGGASKAAPFRRLFAGLFAPLRVFASPQEDLSGTRGALFAFSRRVARYPVRSVAPPCRETRRALAEAADLYEKVRGRLYPDA